MARAVLAVAGAALALVAGASVVFADCGNTAAAVLQGQWQFRETLHYTGVPPPSTFLHRDGYSNSGIFYLTSTCTGPESCKVGMSSSPDPTAGVGSLSTVLYAVGSFEPLVQSGSDYSIDFPSGGFGGQNLPPCQPPSLSYLLKIHVVAAVAAATGTWVPTYITGSEDNTAWWSCNGSTGVPATHEQVTFDAVPAGKSFPSSPAAACASPTAAPVAAGTTPAAPANPEQSTISTGLTEPSGAFATVGHAAVNALITLGIVLFITFPASLFNKTFEENYDDIRDILKRRLGWLRRLAVHVAAGAGRVREVVVFALVVLAGAAIGGLNDPHFGFNSSSLKTYTAVILAVLFGVSVSTLVNYVYRRVRHEPISARLTALPAGLVVAGMCVLVSRLTEFQPGYLYGIICGVAFAGALQARETGQLVAISALATLTLGVCAWFLWVPVKHAASMPGASAWTVIAGNFLASVFVGGLVGSVLSLVPLRFLPGGTLVRWSRAIWGTLFGLAVFGLLQVMLRPESSSAHAGTTAVITAGVLFVLFGGVSVAFRLYFTRRARQRTRVAAPA